MFLCTSTFLDCGNFDGFLDKTGAYLDFTPSGDISSSANVVGQLATLLTSDRIHPSNRAKIEAAYEASFDDGGADEALRVAMILMVSIPEFHTLNKVLPTSVAREPTPQADKIAVPYKAIVSINLFGGMDSMTMLAPHPKGCQALFEEYNNQRGPGLALSEDEMIEISAATSDQPCSSFGVNKHLDALAEMYRANECIFFANVGHLQKPVDRYNFLTETEAQLFSHHSMRVSIFAGTNAVIRRANTKRSCTHPLNAGRVPQG